jgi:ketosteroid isomerase-like protein
MHRSPSLAAAAALVLLAACQPSKPQPLTGVDSTAIDQVRSAFQTAWNTGKVDDVLRVYTDNAELQEQDTPAAKGQNALRTYYNTAMGTPTRPKLEVTRGSTIGRQDLAVESGSFTLTPPAPPAPAKGPAPVVPAPTHGKYLVVLLKQADKSWKIAYHAATRDAAPAPPPAPAKPARRARRGR